MATVQLKNIVVSTVANTNTYSHSNPVIKIVNIHGLVLDKIPQPIKLNGKLFRSGIYLHATPKYNKN